MPSDIPELSEALTEQLRSSVCSAVVDLSEGGDVPNASKFAQDYLQGLATAQIPPAKLMEIAEGFESLYASAVANDRQSFDIRLQLMSLQYC